VRKLAKLVLFFSLSFAVLFLVSAGMRFLAIRIEWVRALSLQRETVLVELITAARWALSFALYGGILWGISYIVRGEVFAPLAILCIILLTLGFVFGINEGLENWENVPPARTLTRPLGGPGLILSNSVRSNGTVIVLLEGPSEPGGRRVIATPGKLLQYQAEFTGRDQSLISLPPAPFNDNCPWFLKSLAIDLRLNAEKLRQLLGEGLLPFLAYTGALIFLLSSLMFFFKFSAWPVVNLFLACLAFRGILALETFFNSPEMQEVFDSFLQNRLPLSLAVPLIFCTVGSLLHLYSFLVYLIKGQKKNAV
jgi:hypothetical protein